MKLLSIISILSLLTAYSALRFNKPRILLPLFSEVRVNYTLEVLEKGCFNFRVSSGPELIQIQPIFEDDGDCAYKVLITATSRERTRKTATVLAESRDTGEVLRCDVILDLIHTFGVHTTTRELFLEEAPETFELKAQDNQGNDFTSLEGIEFNWKLGLQSRYTKDQSGQARQQVLRFLTFSESKYHNVPREVEKFETLGKKGHMILLDGINSGSAKVIVKLPYAEYSNIPEVEVDITVLANLIIDPIDVNILVGDSINFRVLQLKQGKLHEITLGSQYFLEIVDTRHAEIDGGLATGLSLGATEVQLRDRNVIENTSKTIMPKARLNVVEAEKITLNLLPHFNWVTVVSEKHDIAIDLYTKTDERITLGSKYRMDSSFDGSLFKESTRTFNGSRIHGEAFKVGTNQVSGSYLNLLANAEMLIYGKIELTPRLVVLPYDVNKPVNQKLPFKATGGDGSFTFSTANSNMLTIAQTGLAESHLDRLKDVHYDVSGSSIVVATTVKAAMMRNPKIFKTADVLFLPPVKLQIVGFNLETAINGYIDIHVALSALHKKEYLPFTACENLQFDIEFSSQIFTIVSMDSDHTAKANNACRLIRLKGIHTGSSFMKISYRHGEETLQDDAQLLVHDQLIVFNPESNVIVLPIGSSRNIIYQNGPRKTYSVGSELIKSLQFAEGLIDVTEIQSEYQEQRFAYKVLCRKVGDTKVRLEIYNALSQDNFIRNSAVIETTVHCVKPRFINLLSLDKLKTSCPIDSKSSLLHVRSMQDALDIEIEVLDQQKRKLQNITSLFIDLIFSQPNGVINHKVVYNRESETDEIDGVVLPKRDFVRTSMTEDVNYKIKAIVKDYETSILKELKIQPEAPVFGVPKSAGSKELVTPLIENELDFLSFDSSLLPMTSISLFLAPGLSQRIRLGQGSGYYEIKVKNPSLLDARHDKSSSELVLVAKQIGETFVEISDRCLKTEPSRLEVSIVSVGHVELSSPDRVEKSKSIEAIAKLFDSNNHLVDVDHSKIDVYQLSEKVFSERILTLKRGHQENLQRGEIRYVITGNELGETKVVVSSGSVSSTPANVQVFPPLQLIPRNATILVGSTLEITSRGGPKPDTNIVYQIGNSDVLSIDGSVVEGLKVGKTKIIGRSVGTNPADGNVITFSEDSIFITVIPLRNVKIRAPLQRLKSGNIMPVSLWAEPDVSPMVLGTLKKLKIRWNTDAPDVVELKDVFEDLGVIYSEDDVISMRVRGLKQGKARITARVYHEGSKFQATADVTVFKTLELESPKRIIHDPIIIPPRTSLQLKVNMDETVFEMNEQADRSLINVSRDGIVKTFDMLGTSLIVASTRNDQKLDVPVEVKNVNYIMATVVPSIQMKGIEKHLPRDLNFVISVSLHDNLGNEFSHSFEDIKWKSSDRNSVEVRAGDNFTISVGLLRETSNNVLAIGLRDASGLKYPEDYMKLSVKAPLGIFNKKLVVTTGDLICFESPLSDGFPWHSFNSDILLMHGSVGRVLSAPANQKLSVHNGEKNGIYIDYELDVRQPDSLQFQKSFDVFNGVTYRGYFTVSNHQQVDKLTNLIANNQTHCDDLQESFPIDFVVCKLSSLDNGEVLKKFESSPVFDKNAGSYACEIRALASLEEITTISRSRNINLQLEARLASGILDKLDLKLTPAVQITPRVITTDQLEQQEITVVGMENILQKVEVTSSHPDYLVLILLPKTSGRLQYRLKLQNLAAVDSEMFISVTSPLTVQTVRIPIVPPSAEVLKDQTSDWVVTLMSNIGRIIAICVLVLTSIAITLMCQRNRDLDTNGVFQNQRNVHHPNQTLINNSNSNVFTASPLQSQRINSSPIKLSPTMDQQPVYGDPTLSSPFRRYHKRTL